MTGLSLKSLTIKARRGVTALLLACCFCSCGNDIEKIKIFEHHDLPDSTIKNAHIRRSSNGQLQVLMEAPIIRQYSKPEPKTEYPKGVKMRFFNGYNKPTGILTARYAVSFDKRQETFIKDSVVIIDLQSGDTVYLQDLTWNSMQHRVYSDKPLRSKNGRRITLGDSFESDDEFNSPKITHQRGTIEWKEE